MDQSSCNSVSPPPVPRKKIRFTVSEPILRLAQRMAREEKLRRELVPPPSPPPVPETTTAAAAVPGEIENLRSTYRHKRITAVLSLDENRFALDNGVDCVVDGQTPGRIVEELIEMHVGTLHCFDESTYAKWRDVRKEFGKDDRVFAARLKVFVLKPFPIKPCIHCEKTSCPLWHANAGIAHSLKIPFDPVPHSETPEPKRRVFHHDKTAAVLAIGGTGFTLTNGVESVSYERCLNNPNLLREVLRMKVRVLNCMDERTHKMWRDVQRCYEKNFEKLQVYLLKPVEMRACEKCKNTNCHKWKASVGVCDRYKLRFDPIEH